MSSDKKFRSGFVSVIGRTNVGKSTLVNSLTGQKLSIISSKPQTTRTTIKSILTTEDSQIIFIDTPGFHKPRNKLGEFMVNAAVNTLNEVDIVLFVTDVEHKEPGAGDMHIIRQLQKVYTPIYLIINKIDTIEKQQLLPLIKKYSEIFGFKAVLPLSAKTGDGIEVLKNEVEKILPEGPKYFSEDMVTDQPEKRIVAEMIREKLLNLLDDEIPHGIGVDVEKFEERKGGGIADVSATIYCERESHKGIIIGRNGQLLKKVGELSRLDIERFFGIKTYLQLWVKVKKDWRNSDNMLKSLGFQ
jgi:GTP-binding protein Era